VPVWALHGDGRRVEANAAVGPNERLSWPLTFAVGGQHLFAMAGATLLIPAITGLSPGATLLFSGVGTLLFLIVTRNQLPAYLGSSAAFLAPLTAAQGAGPAAQLGGVLVVGLVLAAVGIAVKAMGNRVVDALTPPVVTGAVVMLLGFGLAPTAVGWVSQQPALAALTLLVLLLVAAVPGLSGRFAVLAGMLVGWGAAAVTGGLDQQRLAALTNAPWLGPPELTVPQITPTVVVGMLPVVIVLAAETVAGVKAIGAITGRRTAGRAGDALLATAVATTCSGFGGPGATIHQPNIGVLAASRIYSTAGLAAAALFAVLLSFSPKAAAWLLTIPAGVLGGAALVLAGLIAVHGAKLWLDNRVELTDPLTLMALATALVAGVGNLTLTVGDVRLGGLVWGTLAIVVGYRLLRVLRRPGTRAEADADPAEVPEPRIGGG
jgi:uracil-xanthine permease